MILLKYTKLNCAKFVPHLDVLRCFNRTIRRAQLQIEYSKGFNPHMLLFFAQPLPLGVASVCELCVADSNESPEHFMAEFNKKSIEGISILKAAYVEKNINVAGVSAAAGYEIKIEGISKFQDQIQSLLQGTEIVALERGKEKNIRPLIHSIDVVSEDLIFAVIASGNTNLRADTLAKTLCKSFQIENPSLDILRKKMYNKVNNILLEIF